MNTTLDITIKKKALWYMVRRSFKSIIIWDENPTKFYFPSKKLLAIVLVFLSTIIAYALPNWSLEWRIVHNQKISTTKCENNKHIESMRDKRQNSVWMNVWIETWKRTSNWLHYSAMYGLNWSKIMLNCANDAIVLYTEIFDSPQIVKYCVRCGKLIFFFSSVIYFHLLTYLFCI